MNLLHACSICHTNTVDTLIDFGQQPLSNRFVPTQDESEFLYQLVIGFCQNCGLTQLVKPPKADAVRSRYAWITYNEPESHLDNVVEKISTLPSITADSSTLGLTYKDGSTLERLKRLGFKQVRIVEPVGDLGITEANAGLETIQGRVSEPTDAFLSNCGSPQILIARHILEHAHDIMAFLQALKKIVNPHGYVILEVPDNEAILRLCDYSFIWEEHAAYFTESSFLRCLAKAGFSLVEFKRYPYPYESSLVAILKPAPETQPYEPVQNQERKLLTNFQSSLPTRKANYRAVLQAAKMDKRIALMGAGHQAVAFINLLELKDLIDIVIDDQPQKIGLYLPGSKLPIVDSSNLNQNGIEICLTSLNPESEKKVRAKNQEYLHSAGEFYSIFCAATNFFHASLLSRRSM